MITAFHHPGLTTPDLDRAVAFYCDNFGFEVTKEMKWEKGSKPTDDLHRLKDSAGRAAMLKMQPPVAEDGSEKRNSENLRLPAT